MSDLYHLLISDGGDRCICIIKAPNRTKVLSEHKLILEKMYGDYILVSIHYLSLNCYPRLEVYNGVEEFLKYNG